MSKIMRAMYAAARDSSKLEERKRYSTLKHDSGYLNFREVRERRCRLIVRVDGEIVKRCLTADERDGFVVCAVLPGGKFSTYQRFGVVRCELVCES